jgi:hypothetical protein
LISTWSMLGMSYEFSYGTTVAGSTPKSSI